MPISFYKETVPNLPTTSTTVPKLKPRVNNAPTILIQDIQDQRFEVSNQLVKVGKNKNTISKAEAKQILGYQWTGTGPNTLTKENIEGNMTLKLPNKDWVQTNIYNGMWRLFNENNVDERLENWQNGEKTNKVLHWNDTFLRNAAYMSLKNAALKIGALQTEKGEEIANSNIQKPSTIMSTSVAKIDGVEWFQAIDEATKRIYYYTKEEPPQIRWALPTATNYRKPTTYKCSKTQKAVYGVWVDGNRVEHSLPFSNPRVECNTDKFTRGDLDPEEKHLVNSTAAAAAGGRRHYKKTRKMKSRSKKTRRHR